MLLLVVGCGAEERRAFSHPAAVGGSSGTGGVGGVGGNGQGAGPAELPLTVVDDLEPEHLLADPSRGRIYVTVGGAASSHANSLVVVDPSAAKVVFSVQIGSEPRTMAMSDDGTTLWVSLTGANAIRRVDLASSSPKPEDQYTLPKTEFGEQAPAGPMVVLPGTTGSVALSLHRPDVSPSYSGSVVLDDGEPRPEATPGHTGAARLTAGPEGWLFGYNNLHTGFGFYTLEVSAAGLASTEHQSLVSGFSTDIVYAEDRVYATDGAVIDVSAPSTPTKLGTFAYDGAVLPLPAEQAVLMVSAPFSEDPVLRRLDTESFTQIDSLSFTPLELDGAADLVLTDGVVGFIGYRYDKPPALYLLANPFE